MIRVRAYKFVLGMPLALAMLGFAVFVFADGVGFAIGMRLFGAGFALQALFALSFACPVCSKSPYAIGPHAGPLSFVGKPWPDKICSSCGHAFF